MASTIYRRPDLFPFSFASIPDLSVDPTYMTFGTAANTLEYLTNLLTFQVSVSYSFTWQNIPVSPGDPRTVSVSANINLPSFSPSDPGATNTSTVSWYNTDTSGTKRISPAARVLYSTTGASPIVNAFTGITDPVSGAGYGLIAHLRPSRSGSVTKLALRLYAPTNDGFYGFEASFDPMPGFDFATTTVSLPGTSATLYLRSPAMPVGSYTVVSPVTFSATVTPTFAAA